MKLILTVMILLLSQASIAESLICAKYKVEVSPVVVLGGTPNGNHKISITNNSKSKTYEFPGQNEFIKVKCTKSNNKTYLIVNNNCGGSSCADHNLSILNIENEKIILKPISRYKSNIKEAELMLNKKIKPFNCKEKSTLCYSAIFK